MILRQNISRVAIEATSLGPSLHSEKFLGAKYRRFTEMKLLESLLYTITENVPNLSEN